MVTEGTDGQDTPVEVKPTDDTSTSVPIDVPAPTVDDPILTTSIDVPAAPLEEVINTAAPPVQDTPEPATVTLLALGGVGALIARRKRRTA